MPDEPTALGNIEPIEIQEEMERSFLDYAMSVITSRALPDARDGLKPVQRRILYAMYQNLRLTAGARPRKSAAIVGEMLGDLGAETVPLRATFDAMLEEPTVLPSAIPQLLMNGSTGIAVGMATNIPPHNLSEVVAALTAMIDEPDLDVKGLLKHVKGPDFPTGGEILNTKKELRDIYESGQGAVRLRGQYRVESLPRGKRQIVVTSIPYTVNKAELVEQVAQEIMARKLPQVLDVRDEIGR